MCAERYNQIHGGKDIKPRTVDKSRLEATSETPGYVLKVQADGSLEFEPVLTYLNDILDVEITSVADNNRLAYDLVTGKWVNKKMIYSAEFRAYLLE